MTATKDKMKVEIWSDVMCPFCYIGKRKFEAGMKEFDHSSDIEIIWRSFQLAPEIVTEPGKNIHQFLAEHKGMSLDQAEGLNDQVATMALESGLTYNFDKAIPANSFMAHRFSHIALHHGVQDQAEEALFKAYFTDCKNIDDIHTLLEIGAAIGMDPVATKATLESDRYADEVIHDIDEAQQIGVRGVPFFVFDRKYAISGAQDSRAFLEILDKSFAEWQMENASAQLEVTEGPACTPDGTCD